MSDCFKSIDEYIKHPKFDGVYLKHLFDSKNSDRLNSFEILIVPGFEIPVHIHEACYEFFYFVSGVGEVLCEGEWIPFKPGDAAYAQTGREHGIKNTGREAVKVFALFTPPQK